MEDAKQAVEELKENPEFSRSPTNPTLLPIGESYRSKLLDNLKTLKKFNLLTTDSLRSAYSFAFMVQETPIQPSDLKVLSYFADHPFTTLVKAAENLSVAPKTVSRSLDRLGDRNGLRFHSFLDQAAFNLQTVMVFFIPGDDSEWELVEKALYSFPFTKTLLKTSMTDLGYISVVLPNSSECLRVFYESIKALSTTVFDYMSIHPQMGTGASSNISLYQGGKWSFPEEFASLIYEDGVKNPDGLHILWSTEYKPDLTKADFYIGAEMKLDVRASPSKISEGLRYRGIEVDSRKAAQSMKKLQNEDLLLPYVSFAGTGLSANFCFEIVCDDEWKTRLVAAIGKIPTSIYYLSSRGIILWIQVPSYHQVDYYKILRTLEEELGVKSVQPIMTIKQVGSRTVLDLVRNLTYGRRGWSGDPLEFDLAAHVADRI
jgi:hypothetical protein